MRTNILIAIVCLAGSRLGHTQGTVNFANAGAGINAPVYVGFLTGPLASTGWMAQLVLDTGGGSLTAVGSPASFIGSAAPGYFNGGVVTVSQVAPGALGTFQIFAWDSATGVNSYAAALAAWSAGVIHGGYSGSVTITTGGAGSPPSVPASLVGLQPWGGATIPEVSTTLLGFLGAGALLLWRTAASKKEYSLTERPRT